MRKTPVSRRGFLRTATAASLALPFYLSSRRRASAEVSGGARRAIFFYFPDGVPGTSQDGNASEWHASGNERNFTLPDVLSPLLPFKDACVFFNGLSMGGTDSGSHPGGAKKLLTGVDGGNGESIDQFLARTAGAGSPFRHLYLGAQAAQGNASGDKFISYVRAGTTVLPEDSPARAFARIFNGNGNGGNGGGSPDPTQVSVIDSALADLNALRQSLGEVEKAKLDLHLQALREVELRVKGMGAPPMATCQSPRLDSGGVTDATLYDPKNFPLVLRAHIDVLVQAMACGQTQVGVVQCSQHTSELIMSRFPMTQMYDPNFDMRSHQASHYGPKHDAARREYRDYVAQRKWFVQQFAYLLDQLRQRKEGDGTMLDYSVVLLCSEVCDGNTHSHDNMPFILAGRGGGAINTGRVMNVGYRRHGDLLCAIAHAMGQRVAGYGQDSSGPLPGLLA